MQRARGNPGHVQSWEATGTEAQGRQCGPSDCRTRGKKLHGGWGLSRWVSSQNKIPVGRKGDRRAKSVNAVGTIIKIPWG